MDGAFLRIVVAAGTVVFATVIGASPMAFALAYLGTISFYWQFAALLAGALVFGGAWGVSRLRRVKTSRECVDSD